jgi:hypothetical protein
MVLLRPEITGARLGKVLRRDAGIVDADGWIRVFRLRLQIAPVLFSEVSGVGDSKSDVERCR